MLSNKTIVVIIPALNEEKTLPKTLGDIPRDMVDEIVVVDNGSTDRTPSIASELGATLLYESKKGYGYPCLRGIEYLKNKNPDIVVFLDANYSDHPDEIPLLIAPIVKENYDLVLGSRVMGKCEKGALRVPVYLGNLLATTLIRFLYRFKYTDFGPFRAIKFNELLELDMHDNLGWTIEMQVKAIKKGYKIKEVAVSYRRGAGKSKFTGNIKGIIVVGYRIIWTVFKYLTWKPD